MQASRQLRTGTSHVICIQHVHCKDMAYFMFCLSSTRVHEFRDYRCFRTKARCTYDTKPIHMKADGLNQDLSGLSWLTQPCSHILHFVLQRLTQHVSCPWQRMPLPVDVLPYCAELCPIHLHFQSKAGAAGHCTMSFMSGVCIWS